MSQKKTIITRPYEPLMGRLAAGLAHEFNNLFTAISGSAEIAMLDLEANHRIRHDLETICRSSARGSEMIRQLLFAAGKQRMNREKINELGWDRILKPIAAGLPASVTFVMKQSDDPLWPIYVDREQLALILGQLVDNAVQAMPDGGKIHFSLDNVQSNARQTRRSGPYLRMLVEDQGRGLDENQQEQLFEPFYTTRLERGHSGLGLSVVQGIVSKHGGWVEVNSLPGEGTQMAVYWPAQPDWRANALWPTGGMNELSRPRVLVVEDEEDVREFTMMGLSRDGFKVSGAASAHEAETMFGDEEFELVLSDVGLPDGNGVELIERLVTRQPALKVVLSSGYSDHHHRWPAIRERGIPFLEKPYALQDLIATMRQMNA